MSSGDDHRIGTDAQDPELECNRKEESELSLMGNLTISDLTGDSLTNEKDFSSLTRCKAEMVQALYSEDVTIQIQATRKLRKLVSDTRNPLKWIRDEIIKSGTIPRFVHFLEDSRYPALQYESASVLTNIVRGTSAQTQVVIDAGAVPLLIRLLSSSDETVVEQSVWALGNIAGDSSEYRELVLNSNVLPPLLGIFTDDANASLSLMRIAALVLMNLCSNKSPLLNSEQVLQCLPHLVRLMANEDEEVLFSVCLALTHLLSCDARKEPIPAVIESGICPRALQLLSHTSTEVVKGALLLVRKIAAGDTSNTQAGILDKALPTIGRLLSHKKKCIVKDACWVVYHIANNGLPNQAIHETNIILTLNELLHHRDLEIVRVASMTFVHAIAIC